MRRLVWLVSAVVLVDTMFYAAIAPLLPYYEDRFDLGKAGAGILAGAYPAGTLLFSLAAGRFAARWGVRPVLLGGLSLTAVASVGFALGDDIVVLDVSRFLQGVGGACSWAAGLTWLITAAPPERRGGLIGSAIGVAVAGALFGPVLGTAARALGTEPVFSGVGVLAGLLAVGALRLPPPPRPVSAEPAPTLRSSLRVSGMRLVGLSAARTVSGAMKMGSLSGRP